MSELRNALLDALGEGPKTTDQLVEDTGYERRQVAVELQHMGGDGLVRSGRGGWRPVDATAPPPVTDAPSVRVHHQREQEATPDPVRRKKSGRRPKAAPVREITAGKLKPRDPPASRESKFIFGMSEAGELLVTDRDDITITRRFSAHDTARLAAQLDRWRPMLQPLPGVA